MKNCFYTIKKVIQILVFALNLISFIIMILLTDYKKNNYIQYTHLPKTISNLYIISIFLILLLHSIYPKILCPILIDNLSFLKKDISKMIINLSIGILYWSSNNNPQLVFGIISFVSSFALFLCEFIFQCRILKIVHFDIESFYEEKYDNDILMEHNNNCDMNNEIPIEKKDEKTPSIFPLNEHIHIINNESILFHQKNQNSNISIKRSFIF